MPKLNDVYDLNLSVGGPIMRDKVWFFVNGRTQAATRYIPGIFYNNNAGDGTKWLYSADTSRPQFTDRKWENISGRVTWQATAKHKIGGFWDEQVVCRSCEGTTYGITDPARMSPEAGGLSQYKPLRVTQLTWSSPASNRLLLEAGLGTTYYGWGNFERDPNPTRNLIRVQEQCAGVPAQGIVGCPANGGIPGLFYRSQDFADNYTGAYAWRASASYITGAHSVKIGYQGWYFTDDRTWFTNDQNLTYRLNNGVPNQLTQSISPWVNNARAGWTAFYAQEQWTLGRLTLQGALRYDRAGSSFPEQQIGPTRFLPTPFIFPATKGVDAYNDITPRVGMAWDVFGNGRTALKASMGKYLEGVGTSGNYAGANPTSRMPVTGGVFATGSVSRSWTDTDGDFVPDCDLLNNAANSVGGDICGAVSNARFGQNVLTNSFDPDLLKGWGVRPSDWGINVAVQQQILPRASVEIAYSRRSFKGFTVTDNLATTAADYQTFSITAPSDPRLPDGGGYVISNLKDVNPALFGTINNLLHRFARASATGLWYFNGFDFTVSVRMPNGLNFQGGTSTGENVADNCDVRDSLPELNSAHRPGSRGIDGQPDEPLLPRRLRLADAVPRTRQLHDPEDRRAGQRRDAEQAGTTAGRELRRARRPNHAGARPSAGRRWREPDHQPGRARLDVWESRQPARFPCGQDPEVRQHEDDGRPGSLQRAELRRDPQLQQRVRAWRHMAAADLDPDWTHGQDQRGVYVLEAFSSWRRV